MPSNIIDTPPGWILRYPLHADARLVGIWRFFPLRSDGSACPALATVGPLWPYGVIALRRCLVRGPCLAHCPVAGPDVLARCEQLVLLLLRKKKEAYGSCSMGIQLQARHLR